MTMLPPLPVSPKVPITVAITDGIDESGAPNVVGTFNGYCIFDESSKIIMGGDGIAFTITGTAIIEGDIAPSNDRISGYASINSGSGMKILNARRIRHPGLLSVHHTELELI